MTTAQKRTLWLLCCALFGLLCIAFLPLSTKGLIIALVLLVITAVPVWWRIGHSARQWAKSHSLSTLLLALPGSNFRLPVVLVTGEGVLERFKGEPLRITEQGCFIAAPALNELDQLTESLLAERPHWHSQLSLLYTLFVEQHTDLPVLTGQLRELRYQLLRLTALTGKPIPLLIAGWLNGDDSPWFELRGGETHTTVWSEDSACVGLEHWLTVTEPELNPHTQARHAQAVAVGAWQQWLAETVLTFCLDKAEVSPPCQPLAIALRFMPVPVKADSLWAQWLQARTTLSRVSLSRQPNQVISQPFPDALLRLLPRNRGYTPRLRTVAWSIGIITLFAAFALLASAWNNYWLVRHIGTDIRHFDAIAIDHHAARRAAWLQLKTHAERLDNDRRNGTPLGFSLWLYQGARVYPPLMAAIKRYKSPAQPAVQEKAAEQPHLVRLPGMSLFDSGQSRLKTDSTKILVDALVNIRAKPGWLILVTGHTDSTGDPVKNQSLSLARAESVRDWMLHTSDIPAGCFAVQGYGDTRPVQDNTTPTGRAANRRVEISLVPDSGTTCPVKAEQPQESASSPP